MALFKKAENEVAYLKAGLLGFAGSGKTYTASLIATGLARRLGGKRPVAFFDTENGANYVIPIFEREKLELLTVKTRAFADLLEAVKEAEQSCDVLIIDSISHVWTELLEAFQRKNKISRLLFHHWGPIKSEWRQFTDAYLTSRLHIVMAGRAAWEYDYDTNEDGTKDLVKTGTRMRAETEMGYEPSLLLEMERIKEEGRTGWIHRCKVLKDRSDLIDGQIFDDPTFECFEPVVKTLNIGGKHFVLDTERTSDSALDSPDFSVMERRRQQTVLWEEIEGIKTKYLPGSTNREKFVWITCKETVFGTTSDTDIQSRHPKVLRSGRDLLEHLVLFVSETESPPTKVGEFKKWLSVERDRFRTQPEQPVSVNGHAEEEQESLLHS